MKTQFVKALLAAAGVFCATGVMAGTDSDCLLVLPFDTGSASLSGPNRGLLDTLAETYPSATIRVTGHTDAVGSRTANQALSQSRVASVTRYLRGHGGAQMTINGSAHASTIPREATQAASQVNRRVEIEVNDCNPAIFAQGAGAAVPSQLAGLVQGGLTVPVAGGGIGLVIFGLLDDDVTSTSSSTTGTN
ncbi:MAG: OmpA family protein [Brevirhabdus sp.]